MYLPNMMQGHDHRTGRFPPCRSAALPPGLLHELVSELHGSDPDCLTLWQRHRRNLRNALRELYDKAAAGKRGQGAPSSYSRQI